MRMPTGTYVNDNAEGHLEWPVNHLSLSHSYRIPCRTEATRHGRTSQVPFFLWHPRQRFSTGVHAPGDSIHTLIRQIYGLAICAISHIALSQLNLKLDLATSVHDALLFQITSIFSEG